MAGEVEFGDLAGAELDKEGYVDIGESSGGACFGEGALVAVLAPVDGNSGPG